MNKLLEKIPVVIETNIYLIILLAFLSRGEGILNFLLFLNFILWVSTFKFYPFNFKLLRNPVSVMFYLFILSALISSLFSIDPSYSFSQLVKDPLKSFLFWPVFLWIIDNEVKLKKITFFLFLILIIYVVSGYYCFVFKNIYYPDTWLLHSTLNRYGGLLALLISYGIIYLFYRKEKFVKITLLLLVVATIYGIILNATRIAYLSLFISLLIWIIFYFRKHLIKGIVFLFLCLGILGTVGWYSSDFVKAKIIKTKNDFSTFNQRKVGWDAAIEASLNRPITGWGFGKKIFHNDMPFVNTSFNFSPKKLDLGLETPHNTFLAVLFHQGFLGFIFFIGMFFLTIKNLTFKLNFNEDFLNLFRLSVLISYISYFGVFAFFNPTKFFHFTIFTCIGLVTFNLIKEANKNK